MCTRNCHQLAHAQPVDIAGVWHSGNRKEQEELAACIYHCFQEFFIHYATGIYRGYNGDYIRPLAQTAFADGVLSYREHAVRGKITNRGAVFQTVLFGYCRVKLLEAITQEKRLLKKKEELWRRQANNSDYEYSNTSSEEYMRRLQWALSQLDSIDNQIVKWRHQEGLSHREIAGRLGITEASSANKIYRVLEKLKKMMRIDKK